MLGDLSNGHSRVFCLVFFSSAGLGVVGRASAYRKESLCHTSRVLGE